MKLTPQEIEIYTDEYKPDGSEKASIMLILNPEGRYRFQFGVKKAKMILEKIELIKRFVETFDGIGGKE